MQAGMMTIKDSADRSLAEDLAFLGSLILFETVPRPALIELARNLRQESHKPGSLIIRKGDANTDLLIIRSGTVSVLVNQGRKELELTRLGTGSYFGEMSLFDQKPRSATVVAVDKVEVRRIDRDLFCQWAFNYPDMLFQICKIFSHRLRRTNSIYAKR